MTYAKLYITIIWSDYLYQTICLICLNGTKCSTIAWPRVFKVESCLWWRRGFLGSNAASGCDVDFQGKLLKTVPNGAL